MNIGKMGNLIIKISAMSNVELNEEVADNTDGCWDWRDEEVLDSVRAERKWVNASRRKVQYSTMIYGATY